MLLRLIQNPLLVHHHAQVNDFETIAAQDNAGDVLSYVMDISLDGSIDYDRSCAGIIALAGHVRFENRDRVLHDFGGLHDLREEHFAVAEELTDSLHSRHQRSFDDFHRRTVFMVTLQHVRLQSGASSLYETFFKPLFRRTVLAVNVFLCGICGRATVFVCLFRCHYLLRLRDKPLGRIRIPVQDHVLCLLQKIRFNVIVHLQHSRIHDTHVKSRIDSVIEENRMHRLADGVVSSECERQVRNTAGSICSRQVLLYPPDGFDEVNAVFGVLLDSCSYGKDIDIENNVLRRDIQLCGQ